jgi:putative effector of murein hydrolase LrgA (UPF0299 family)
MVCFLIKQKQSNLLLILAIIFIPVGIGVFYFIGFFYFSRLLYRNVKKTRTKKSGNFGSG